MNNIIYAGLFSSRYGYGEAARGYRKILSDNALPIDCVDLNSVDGWKTLEDLDKNKTLVIHKRPTNDLTAAQEKIIHSFKKLIYMTVWECDALPESWLPHLFNVDEIIVPSNYSKISFINSIPSKKVHVLPHLLNPFEDTIRFHDISQDKINILAIASQLTGRKGIDNMVAGYYCLPKEITERCRLIIKGTGGLIRFCKSLIMEHDKPEIIAKEEYMSDLDMDRLLLSGDIFFSPNRGEGYGIDIVRAHYMGANVVATNKGGYMDILNDKENFYPIKAEWDFAYCKSTYHDTNVHGLMWPSPDIKSTTRALQEAIRVTNESKEYNISEINQKIESHNKEVCEIFKNILENI